MQRIKQMNLSCTDLDIGAYGVYGGANIDTTDFNYSPLPDYQPIAINSLDLPYYLAKEGILTTGGNPINKKTITQSNNNYESLSSVVSTSCTNNDGKSYLVNQINYLACQLLASRNREYKKNSKGFKQSNGLPTILEIFNSASYLKIPLILLFVMAMYFVIFGFFGSIDLAGNIFTIIESNSVYNLSYWIGLLIGLGLPVVVLCLVYTNVVSQNLSELENYNITNAEYGVKEQVLESARTLDYTTLILFVVLIYAFSASLLTIKKKNFSNYIYCTIISSILVVLAIFIYLLYAFVPFFNTADIGNINIQSEIREQQFFVDNQQDIANITTNSTQNSTLQKAFFVTFIFILLITIIFIYLSKTGPFFNGLLSSSAIIIIPLLWVFNFYLAINAFYLYPILLIIMRFIRYVCMLIIYIISNRNDSFKDGFSDDLKYEFENFQNYSPSWSLIGVDFLKTLLNIRGHNNMFSESIIPNNDISKNISNNVFMSTGLFGFAIQYFINDKANNFRGMILSFVTLLLAIAVTGIVLFGIVGI